LLYRSARYHANVDSASYAGAYVIGLAFAFGWTPCIGPILATVLTLTMQEASLASGVKLLFAYSLGLGIPFILAAIAIRPFLGFVYRFRSQLGRVEKLMGVVLVATGLLMLSGSLNWFGQWLLDNVPALASVEEWVAPKGLQTEILRRGAGR
jgi:cytochrome c-type biogenesis protein